MDTHSLTRVSTVYLFPLVQMWTPRLGTWAQLAKAARHRALGLPERGAQLVCCPHSHRDGPSQLLCVTFPELRGRKQVPTALEQGRGGSGRGPCHPGRELHGESRARSQAAFLPVWEVVLSLVT